MKTMLIILAVIVSSCTATTETLDAIATTNTTTAPVETATTTAATTTQTVEPASNLTPAQQNAVRTAQDYLEFAGFSRQGLIDQLSSEYGEQYLVDDATAAVDSLNVDWNAQAARSAADYLEFSGFSCQGLIDQLQSEYGEGFTVEQATHGAQSTGIC